MQDRRKKMQGKVNYEVLLQEWIEMFQKEEDYYLYGAANMAKEILRLSEETGVINKIKGCLVTDKNDNPDKLGTVAVYDVHNIENKDAIILVPHSGVYKREIASVLDELGFQNVIFIHHYGTTLTKEKVVLLDDEYMRRANDKLSKLEKMKSESQIEKEKELCDKIIKLREEKQPDFSEQQFYQSFERVGLSGRRPTMYRLEKYGIYDISSTEKSVLDIGCNAGFLDMTVAPYVKSVLGIEYDETLVEVANIVKDYIGVDNCNFLQADFVEWKKRNHEKFEIIFSFAIHHWLNISQEQYAEMLDELLEAGGYLCIESHDLSSGDAEYDYCIELLSQKKFVCINKGEIIDDGIIRRKYMILHKLF